MKTNEEIYRAAIEVWGTDHQMVQSIEECAELIVALSKLKKHGGILGARSMRLHTVTDAIADMEIMMEQLRFIFDSALIDKIKESKLSLLKEGIRVVTNNSDVPKAVSGGDLYFDKV